MIESKLRALCVLAEGENRPPKPTGLAKLRGDVQGRYDAVQQTLPRLHALVNQLAPSLIGTSVDSAAVARIAGELADEAAVLGREATALAAKAAEFGRSERGAEE